MLFSLSETCEKMYCDFGARCVVDDKTQNAYCRCEDSCQDIFTPVCGSDGITYTNECYLHITSCKHQRGITAQHSGHCDSRDPCEEKECPFGSICKSNMDRRTAECVCPEKCATYGDSRGSRPVCGTDGKDYPNECELRRTACREMREISTKFLGRCDPCEGVDCPTAQVCQLDDHRSPICRCNAVCPQDLTPVCGSDGKTYTNECTLRVEACRFRKSLRVIYSDECSTGANPCSSLSCGPGEECDISREGIATCQCPSTCEPVMRPVCGSDRRTYHNHCELKRQACISKREVTLAYMGECGERGPCHQHECMYGAVCVVKSGYPICECPSCTEEFVPVCGTDGISYTNICKMKREGCEQRALVEVAYRGLCNGCENKRCEFYAVCESDGKNGARCICPHSCVKVESSVCGTDGITYLNECEMRVAACNKQQYVVVGSRGLCDLCQGVHCKYGARCENGQCVCPTDCPASLFEPVCATDGSTHYNECDMLRTACIESRELKVLLYGECKDIGSSGQDTISAASGCKEMVCRFGSTCDYDSEGSPVCLCIFECPATKEAVCGSDGVIHNNDCRLKEESCRQQTQLYILPMSMCEAQDYKDIPCEGETPLIDPLTGQDYLCGDSPNSKKCPPSSYCHKTRTLAKCCREVALIKTCADSVYGCCPDDKTSALGQHFAGCPSVCNCYRLGSYGLTCDAETKQCSCKPGVGGLRCDRCEPGYWGLHKATEGSSGCSSCNCNQLGSVRDDCEQMTGRCVCKQGIKGMKCDTCPAGTVLGPDGCVDASISKVVTGSCMNLSCLHGATCKQKVGNDVTAQCVCDFHCTTTTPRSGPLMEIKDESVCGSDGNTYGSECQLKLFSCRYQKPITVAKEGPCKRSSPNMPMQSPTPGTVRRSTVQRVATGDHVETKSTRDTVVSVSEDYHLTTRPTLATPIATDISVYVPSFFGRSYLELPRLQAYARLSLEMEFQTFANEGILLYNGQTSSGAGDFISLSLREGYVEFRYNLGNGPVLLRSPQKLHLGRFHRVTAKRYLRDGMLILDGKHDVAGKSKGSLKSLDLQENLYLGFVPSETDGIFENIAVRTGMVGCIRRLKIGKKLVDLRFPGSRDVVSGNGIRQCRSSLCNSIPCQNNGVCEPHGENEYKCSCLPGFTGKDCDQKQNPCLLSPCDSASTCVPSGTSFVCACPPDKTGKYCESALKEPESSHFIPDFNGESYLEFPTLSGVRHAFSIELWFLSRSPEGTLLYNGQRQSGRGDFVAVSLSDCYIYFRFDLGSVEPSVSGVVNIKSEGPITLNTWHSVRIERFWKNGTLQVDNGTKITAEAMTSLTELNLQSNLYIGGAPNYEVVNPEAAISVGLDGAIQKIMVNDESWSDFMSLAIWSHAIKRYRGPPCGGPKQSVSTGHCLNDGVCIPRLNDVTCKCKLYFWGPKCEKHMTKEDLERPVEFHGKTFLNFPHKESLTVEGQRETSVEVTFRTSRSGGLLLCTRGSSSSGVKGGDYLALAIVDGHVQISFNLGKQSEKPFSITSLQRVDDMQWHTALVERNLRLGSLALDDGPPMFNSSEPGATDLNTDGIFWIGGCPNLPPGLPADYYMGYVGCMERVLVDGDPLHLALHSYGEVTFCDSSVNP